MDPNNLKDTMKSLMKTQVLAYMNAVTTDENYPNLTPELQRDKLWEAAVEGISEAVATTVIAHIQANADLRFVAPQHSAIQTSTAPGSPTGPPAGAIIAVGPIIQ